LPQVEHSTKITRVLAERLVGTPAFGDGVLDELLLASVGVDDVVAVQVVAEAG